MGNPYGGESVTSIPGSRFWLHSDQSERSYLQCVGVRQLEEHRFFGVAGHHTRVTATRSHMSYQGSKAMNRQTARGQLGLFLQERGLRGFDRHHRVAPIPVEGQFLVLEQQRFPLLPQVPLRVIGQQAQKDVRPHSLGRVVVDRAHQQIDPFGAPECLLHQGQPLIRSHPVHSRQPLGGLAGPDHIDPIQRLLLLDRIPLASPLQATVADRQGEMFGHLGMVDDLACSHGNLGCYFARTTWACHAPGQRLQLGLRGRKQLLALMPTLLSQLGVVASHQPFAREFRGSNPHQALTAQSQITKYARTVVE